MQALHAARMSIDPCSTCLNQHTCLQVQQLMEIAPDCPELPDLLYTIRQVACTKLSPQTSSFDCSTSNEPACFCKRGQAVCLDMKSAAAESLANMQMPWYTFRRVEAPYLMTYSDLMPALIRQSTPQYPCWRDLKIQGPAL